VEEDLLSLNIIDFFHMLVSFDKDFCKVPENLFAACLAVSDLLSNERTDVGKKENMRMPNVK